MSAQELRFLRQESDLAEALSAPVAVLYKHSPVCGLSDMAARQVEAFMRARPRVPVYQVDVVRERGLAREIEGRLGVRHESPQAFVLRDGRVTWHGSHRAVTTEAIERALASAMPEAD